VADVTSLLEQWGKGDEKALEALVPLVYRELRQLAASYLRRERAEHTLQPTALVHEAYLRLARESSNTFNNRAHFLGAAATVMRRVLVDHSRRRNAIKRGAGAPAPDIDQGLDIGVDLRVDLLALDQAITRLAELSPAPARVVELSLPYFEEAGLRMTPDDRGREFLASAIGIASASVDRLNQVPARMRFLFDYDAAAALGDEALRAEMRGEDARAVVTALAEELASAPRLTREIFRETANRVKVRTSQKGKALFHPIRVVLTGRAEGPGRPVLYSTTSEFMQHFGLGSLSTTGWAGASIGISTTT
jgi:RNA polymerase sigma factor (TIGR02999 family)